MRIKIKWMIQLVKIHKKEYWRSSSIELDILEIDNAEAAVIHCDQIDFTKLHKKESKTQEGHTAITTVSTYAESTALTLYYNTLCPNNRGH